MEATAVTKDAGAVNLYAVAGCLLSLCWKAACFHHPQSDAGAEAGHRKDV
jgi:hypothetical protein